MKILVTGGSGFIGNSMLKLLSESGEHKIYNIDNLTYASNLTQQIKPSYKNVSFKKIDISDYENLKKIVFEICPDLIINFAAESHVDNSISGSSIFMSTNIIGTYNLLESARLLLEKNNISNFKFLQVSTDEVYGDIGFDGDSANESTQYNPSSPYSASKSSADQLALAWARTYDLPLLITRCTNNFGPFQHPEKLIPTIIGSCIKNSSISIYGTGENIRDWLFVDDHNLGILSVIEKGILGETYNISANNEMSNLEIAERICEILDDLSPSKKVTKYRELITFVDDRAGHDTRYSLDSSKIRSNLNWRPKTDFYLGLKKTIDWYLSNKNIF